MSESRKQRREYEKWLKKSDPKAYKAWKAEKIERGNAFHQSHVETQRILQSERLEAKQKEIIQSLRAAGKTDAQIDEFIESWVEGISPI
jgi:uncharacterized membrane protein YebE (DUF533 family)